MPSSSLTDIGLMMMVNGLFISNYLFIRKLRSIVDKINEENAQTILNRLQRKFNDNRFVGGFRGFSKGYKKTTSNENDDRKGSRREIVYGFLMGRHRMEPCVEKKFPNWQRIPFKLGIVSSASALLLATVLLSDNALTGRLAVSTQGEKSSGFCATDDVEKKIKAFQDHIRGESVTNHAITSLQFEKVLQFNDTLSSDVTKSWVNACDTQQKKEDANARISACTFEQDVCVDDWGWSVLCKKIKVTLPSCLAALEGNVQVEQQEIAVESDADLDGLSQLDQGTAAFMQQLLKQIDIAGSLYSIYICIALFFPTPIVLFKPSIVVQAKQLLFGAGKYTFIATVLIIYWGYEHLGKLLMSPRVQIYLKNLVTDPCFLDSEFIGQRTAVVKETCADLIKMENKWNLIAIKINSIHELLMANCESDFFSCPVLAMGFETFSPCKGVYAPSEFLGNDEICIDEEYSRNEILVAGETGLSLWELWMTSGLLASLLVKIAIANFGVALLKLADPFCICDGKYQSPPEVMNQDLNEEEGKDDTFLHVDNKVKENKVAALKAIAFRECLIWGFFTNASLLSLIVASSSNFDEFKRLDYIVFAVIIVLSLGASFGCFFVTRYTGRIVEIKVSEEDTESKSVAPISTPFKNNDNDCGVMEFFNRDTKSAKKESKGNPIAIMSSPLNLFPRK